jgi:multicomponent Na+:H+ antiporter subunit D
VDLIAILAASADLVLAMWLLICCSSQNIVYWFGNWFPRGRMVLGVGFEIDPVGAGLAVLAALLTLLALIYSWHAMESGQNHYQPLMLIFLAAMSGFVFTSDLFNLFVFFELMSTAAFALCGLKVEEPAPLQGAFNFAVTNTVGAFFILTGIGFLYAVTGALNMAQIGWLLGPRHDSLVVVACVFLITGFLIKAAIAPFHFWLPDAHAVAPTPVCALFSGLMVELGLFAVLRVTSVIFGQSVSSSHHSLNYVFAFLGSLTALWGGAMCFAEHHLKRLLAFSTVSHAGVMLLAIAVGSPIATAGWLIYLFGHAMAKTGLFFTAGILLHRLRTMSEPALFARGKGLRYTAALWLLGGVALAGLPPFAIAGGEELVSTATRQGSLGYILACSFLLSGALTAGAVFRVYLRVFLGAGDHGPTDRGSRVDELPEMHERHRVIPSRLFVPACTCIVMAIAPGFIPKTIPWSLAAASRFLSQSTYIRAIYDEPLIAQSLYVSHVRFMSASSLLHGFTAIVCAALLAAAAVFHTSLPRLLRWPSHLEGRMHVLRKLQSGHPADYVVWCIVGICCIGGCLLLLP